jgi:hypothetical protein
MGNLGFYEKAKKIKNEDNLAINLNFNHRYELNINKYRIERKVSIHNF